MTIPVRGNTRAFDGEGSALVEIGFVGDSLPSGDAARITAGIKVLRSGTVVISDAGRGTGGR